jgi:putative addiction module component (TIGR02574 family)
MNVAEVQSLPLREKFQILEMLWADLSSRVDSAPISESMRVLLDSRIERVNSGTAAILDWDEVKYSIGKR